MLDAKWTAAIDKYLEAIKSDYEQWSSYISRGSTKDNATRETYRQKSIKEFNEKLLYEVNNKYVKVIENNSVHSFIALDQVSFKNGVTFKAGDILKPANWSGPAKNKARGNIFGEYTIKWTGPSYL